MVRMLAAAIATTLVSSCATLPDWVSASPFLSARTDAGLGRYSFDWRLSGDRGIAPLQVFDNGKRTWLQFAPGQVVPAIFAITPLGDRPLSYVRQGEHLILDRVWPQLRFRGGALDARAQRLDFNDNAAAALPDDVSVNSTTRVVSSPVQTPSSGAEHVTDFSETEDGNISSRSGPNIVPDVVPGVTAFGADLPVEFSSSLAPMASPYRVTLQDQNLRLALLRWARQANWTFAPEHWTVDVDIPVSGEATFERSFENSVQDLLAATELADRPLQPCFYSNRVLRVVPYAQACDRSGRAPVS